MAGLLEMKDTVTQFYRDKTSIERGLRDLGNTVGKLDLIFLGLTVVILLLIWLGIFGISIGTYLVAAGSIVLTVSFMVGNSAKNLFESIVFIFFMVRMAWRRESAMAKEVLHREGRVKWRRESGTN